MFIISNTAGPSREPKAANRKGIITFPRPWELFEAKDLISFSKFSAVHISMDSNIFSISLTISVVDSSGHAFYISSSLKVSGETKKYFDLEINSRSDFALGLSASIIFIS